MRQSTAFLLLSVLLAPLTTAAQTIPGVNTPFGGLARTLAGVDIIKAQIADLRRELSRCEGPGASKTGACASRALLQAKLNYLLAVSTALGDPDTAGAPPVPLSKPPDTSSNYTDVENYLRQEIGKEGPDVIYILSENRAKWGVIQHCKAMKDLRRLIPLMTDEDRKAHFGPAADATTKADVTACINEYNAKDISANRKTALEYCIPSTTEPDGRRTLFSLCMHRHDMLTAMCKQELELEVAWAKRKDPQGQHAPQMCPLDRILISPRETQAILTAPPIRAMAELPAKFFAPPDVVIPLRPALPIPVGTVIELRLQGSWDGSKIENVANNASIIPAMLDEALVVDGKTVLGAHSGAHLKGRIIGPGARPATVQIGFTTDEINIDAPDCRVCGKYADLKTNELVFTVPYQSNAQNPGTPLDLRLRFTVGGTGSVEAPSRQTPPQPGGRPVPPQPPPVPPTTVPPPTTAPTPQQQAEDARKRAERIQACVQQAIRDNPTGGLALSQAIAACSK